MNDGPGLDPHTVERMLRGEPIGPPRLAALLAAAASSEPPAERLHGEDGEEAAVAAFQEARSLPSMQPHRRRLTAAGWKAALVGLLLVLAGGAAVAMAATGRDLPGPLGNRQSHDPRTPTISDTRTRIPPRTSPHRAAGHQNTPRRQTRPTPPVTTHSVHPTPAPSTRENDKPHPTRMPKTRASKSKPNKSATATSSAPAPAGGAGRR